MKIKLNILLIAMFFSTLYVTASNVYQLYDCLDIMDYSPVFYTPDRSCKYAETFGMTKTECYSAIQQQYAKANKEFKMGQCKDKGHRLIEGQYNNTSCSIQYMLSPYPKIYGQGYSNEHGMGYNAGEDMDGVKCIDIIYKELKTKYPNIAK